MCLRVNYHLVIEIEGGLRPACVAELIALHYVSAERERPREGDYRRICPASDIRVGALGTLGSKIKVMPRSK
jgi:hypothetical protein